jgi:hypothetical protein
MSEHTQAQVQLKIAQIIERSRHSEEMFLIDSKTAASEIIDFLKQEDIIASVTEKMLMRLQN